MFAISEKHERHKLHKEKWPPSSRKVDLNCTITRFKALIYILSLEKIIFVYQEYFSFFAYRKKKGSFCAPLCTCIV